MRSWAIPNTRPVDRQRQQPLDLFFEQIQVTILSRQDPITGLLPFGTTITVQGDHNDAWIQDNLYGILGVWGVALAYRYQDNDEGRRYLLEQSIVKLMRGLIVAMMKRVVKIESFRPPWNAWGTGTVEDDLGPGYSLTESEGWSRLPTQSSALFLLLLTQMTASGLRIVFTLEEVNFIQCLVHHLSHAYRMPNQSHWGQGSNPASEGMNAGSVGVVKAALEAVEGFDLFGAHGGPQSVIHVMADDIVCTRRILESLLQRESNSTETDVSLATVVGFPGFAVEDPRLVEDVRNGMLARLLSHGPDDRQADIHQRVQGGTGRASMESSDRERSFLFAVLLIDAMLAGDGDKADRYRHRLENALARLPAFDDLSSVTAEPPEIAVYDSSPVVWQRIHPHLLLWIRNLSMLGILLHDGLIRGHDLDPLGRRGRIGRYRNTCVQMAVLAATEQVRQRLQSQGISTQTRKQVDFVEIYPATVLETLLEKLGANHALGLSGRTRGRLGTLTTSRVFILGGGKTAVFTPLFCESQVCYLTFDGRWLAKCLVSELKYVYRYWNQSGQPLILLPISEAMLDGDHQGILVALLQTLQQGHYQGINIRMATLSELLPVASWKRMDILNPAAVMQEPLCPSLPSELPIEEYSETRCLTADEIVAWHQEADDNVLLQQLLRSYNLDEQIELALLLWERLGADFYLEPWGVSLRQLIEVIYTKACEQRLWGVIRRAAGRLGIVDETLEQAVTEIVIRGYQLSLGRARSNQALIARPLNNTELMDRIRAYGGENPRYRILIQELIVLLGMLVYDQPDLCRGMVTLRPWHLLLLLSASLAKEQGIGKAEAFNRLLETPPYELAIRLHELLEEDIEVRQRWMRLEFLKFRGEILALDSGGFSTDDELTLVGRDVWSVWREINGALFRLPADFYNRVALVLEHCPGLIIGDQLDIRNRLNGAGTLMQPVLIDEAFVSRVEQLLMNISASHYRQLNVETLLTLADVFTWNPNLYIDEDLVLDALIDTAVYWCWSRSTDAGIMEQKYNERCSEAWSDFYAGSPRYVAKAIQMTLGHLLAARGNHGEVTA